MMIIKVILITKFKIRNKKKIRKLTNILHTKIALYSYVKDRTISKLNVIEPIDR